MLSSVEQAFVGRDERASLKTPAWKAITDFVYNSFFAQR